MNQALARQPESSARPAINILLIEDNDGDALIIREMLEEMSSGAFSVFHAPTIEAAEPELQGAYFQSYCCLTLTFRDFRAWRPWKNCGATCRLSMPIIVMTGMDDEKRALAAMQRGVQD